MKWKLLLLVLIAVMIGALAIGLRQKGQPSSGSDRHDAIAHQTPSRPTSLVPAHYATPPSMESLAATLPPERFPGKAREAYRVAKEIPQTLAQLPCYCHCDRSLGHKSLHSCFEDEHASSCAVCVNEALTAYQLQKQGMTPPQIRDRIIAEYSNQ